LPECDSDRGLKRSTAH